MGAVVKPVRFVPAFHWLGARRLDPSHVSIASCEFDEIGKSFDRQEFVTRRCGR